MAARLGQGAKRRAEKKLAPAMDITIPLSVEEIVDEKGFLALFGFGSHAVPSAPAELKQQGSLSPHPSFSMEAGGAALWDEAVRSLGRSAAILEELAESTAEAVARIAARGDRIDRIQAETRALLKALTALEADA